MSVEEICCWQIWETLFHTSRLYGFLCELRRRKVYRAAVGYSVTGWLDEELIRLLERSPAEKSRGETSVPTLQLDPSGNFAERGAFWMNECFTRLVNSTEVAV